jgi:deoxyribodipyrimidine photo-lyase
MPADTPPRAPAILWFRQDLRLGDNPALIAALKGGARIIPVYVLDDEAAGAWAVGGASRWWLHHSLVCLSASLKAAGAPLILRRGRAETIIPALAAETGAATVHAGIAHEPFWRRADARIAKSLQAAGRSLHLHRSATLIDPETIRTRTGTVYGMYSPFARAVEALGEPSDPHPAPREIPSAKATASDELESWRLLPTRPDWSEGLRATWTPGESAALKRLDVFLANAAARYGTSRNLPGEDGTSMLSPYLHFGEISPGTVWHAVRRTQAGADQTTYLRELIWREFSAYLLWHYPTLPKSPLRPAFASLPFRNDRPALRAWQQGRTGVPIVDAGMRQLWQTGWMHNRVRMIVASFLVKHLLISWQEGEAWFWDTLVDADLASNAASWQWVTGCGIDSQPFFRVFNPVTQGEKFDSDGAYVRRFVPELAGLPDRYLHAPWTAPPLDRAAAGVKLGTTYPAPLVDLAEGRNRALEAYRGSVRVPAS